MKLLLKLIPALAFVLCLIFTPNIEASWRYFYNMPQQEEQTSFLLETFIYSSNYPSVDDAINDPNSSENVFDGSADFVIDSDSGEINIESTTKTTNVYFTVDFIYSLQQMGYTKIKLQNYSNDISIYGNIKFYNYTYPATGEADTWFKLFLTTSFTIDISTPLTQQADGSYTFVYNNQTYTATNAHFEATSETGWTIENMTFE